MTTILSLPPELLETICDFLEPNDLKNVGLTCKTIYDVISLDTLWRNFVSRKYQIEPDQYPASTARAFYQRILHPYGPILGLWIMEFNQFGGLLRVYVEDGCIVGEEIFSPPWNRWEGRAEFVPLSRKKIFQILPDVEEAPEETDGANGKDKDKDKQPSIRCLIGLDETPELGCDGKQSMLVFHDPQEDRLHIRCLESAPHEHKMNAAFKSTTLSEREMIVWRRGHKRWMANWFACECARIRLNPFVPDLPPPLTTMLPTPGFFVGDYNGHGTEIVAFEYISKGWFSEIPFSSLRKLSKSSSVIRRTRIPRLLLRCVVLF